MTTDINSGDGFSNLGIAPKLLEVLSRNKYTIPTPIQKQSIPAAIEGKDIMGIAQTGTGKTLAFGIPMIQRLAQNSNKARGLVILPTRELALQVNETLKKIGGVIGLKTAIIIGGEAMGKQLKALRLSPHIIIATPGRLIDHMESGSISLSNVEILVLDEADRMLDMGFAPQINKILQRVSKHRQTMLFSATMPDEIVSIAHSYMSLPLRIEIAPAGTPVEQISQELFIVQRDSKAPLLQNILKEYKGSVLVFSRTKFGAKKIAKSIRDHGHTAAEIHSNRSLNQRLEALDGFKIGRYRVLVATDIAARGIDVTGIQLVLNYDLPSTAEDYVHRIGRTGRAGLAGHAISFATPDQRYDIRSIERLIKRPLPVSQSPTLSAEDRQTFSDPEERQAPRSGYRQRPERRFENPSHHQRREFRPSSHDSRPSHDRPSNPSPVHDRPGYERSNSPAPFKRKESSPRRENPFSNPERGYRKPAGQGYGQQRSRGFGHSRPSPFHKPSARTRPN